MFFDTSHNSIRTALSNYYATFHHAALRMYHYTRSLPTAQRPNVGIITSKYSHSLVRPPPSIPDRVQPNGFSTAKLLKLGRARVHGFRRSTQDGKGKDKIPGQIYGKDVRLTVRLW